MKFGSSKIFSNKNLINFLYLVTFGLSVGYLVNKEYLALICLLVLAGLIYFIGKNILYALGISIIITNLLLSAGSLKTLENFKENNETVRDAANAITCSSIDTKDKCDEKNDICIWSADTSNCGLKN
tara:strand:+ start:211 stop:591 length:381 start_codon:yes stop_codon:yes gene_type:complete